MGVATEDKPVTGDRPTEVAHQAIKNDCTQLGDGEFVAMVDSDADEVSVYRVFAEEGTGDGSQLSQHLERVFHEPTAAVEKFFE